MKVFISHTAKDRKVADALAYELKKRKISTFFDVQFLPGSSLEKQATSSLKESDAIIAILSQHSFSSEWVRKEIDEALFNEKFKNKFFPVLLSKDNEDLSRLPWVLQKINHLRLSPDEKPEILGKKIAQKFQQFIERGL